MAKDRPSQVPKKLNGRTNIPRKLQLKGNVTVADLFDRYAPKQDYKTTFYTKSGDTAVNDEGEDKSTGVSFRRAMMLRCLAEARKPQTAADIANEINMSDSSVRQALIAMHQQGLVHLTVPPQPVVYGRRRPYQITQFGRAVLRALR